MGIVAIVGGLVAVAAALLGAGGDSSGSEPPSEAATVTEAALAPGTTAPVGDGGLGATVVSSGSGRSALAGFGEAEVTITSPDGETCVTCMLLATELDQRVRGLMEVTDPELGGYDGMLFTFDQPVDGAFWMRNTPLPLTIAYLDAGGAVVSLADAEPCADLATCPRYPADAAFQYVIEVPVDQADGVDVPIGSTIAIEAFACSEASAEG